MLDFFVERRDFGYGSGFISPDATKFYVNIPKNASTFTSSWLMASDWSSTTVGNRGINWNKIDDMIVIMRDPVDRWISGISQYIKGHILGSDSPETFILSYTELTEKFIENNLDIFDDHVWPQHCFFENILPDIERKYMYICPNFEETMKKELNLMWPIPNTVYYNKSEDDDDLRKLKAFFKERVKVNNNLHNAIKNIYKKDYNIISNNFLV